MWSDCLWGWLEERIFSLPGASRGEAALFNPYGEQDERLDLPGAQRIRQENLRHSLECLPEPPPVLLIGEAPGWRGCRFSGVPFVSEAQLVEGELPFHGRPTSRLPSPVREASATIFWEALASYHPEFFAWNCLPLHPGWKSEPCSNRLPTRQEIRRFLPELEAIYKLLHPRLVLAVGRQAGWALGQAGIPATPVRHPSHGGKTGFEAGIKAAFSGLRPSSLSIRWSGSPSKV